MDPKLAKQILMYTQAGLLGTLALKVFGVTLIQSWGAWWLLQIFTVLAYGGLFVHENKAAITEKIEEIQKKGGSN